MADPQDTWYVCKESFVTADPDLHFHGRQGITRVRGSDPVYRRWPQYFEPMKSSDKSVPEVEEAVAPPGRKRGG